MKKRIILFGLVVSLGSLMTSGCEYAINEALAIEMATNAALGTPPEPLYQTAAAIYLHLTLTPTPQPMPYGTPTMSVMDFAATQAEQVRADSLTQQAREYALEQEKIAAQERAEAARLAAEKAEKTAQAVDAIRTANAQATRQAEEVTAQAQAVVWTAQAQATATQQALIWLQGTQAAQASETARVEPTHALWTQTAVYIQNRIQEGQAREVELAVRRQEMKNVFDAYGPWLLVIFIALVSSDGFRKWLKTRVFRRDEHGKTPVVAMETAQGQMIVRPDLFASPVVRIQEDGTVTQPMTTNPAEQAEVTRRAQAIEAISMVPPPYARQGVKMVNTEFGGRSSGVPTVLLRNNPALGPVLDEAEAQLLEDA